MSGRIFSFFLFFFVFATGAAGLIYEVAWQKYLGRLLGSDTMATAVILATFLGGLSAGYYLCGKLTTKVKNHFKAYALLEGVIAVWGLGFPAIFTFIDLATKSWSFSPPVLIILQGMLCSAVLMGIPTICMGGTIPLLTRGVSRNVVEATGVHARVYGVNTAGAFAGTLGAGFFLIPSLGLPLTVMSTAVLNLSAALFFFLSSAVVEKRRALVRAGAEADVTLQTSAPPRYPPLVLYTVAFLSGFYVMTLENVLIRLVNLSLGSSSYSFTMIVSVFVLSIAVGSIMVGRMKDLRPRLLFFNQLLIALLLLVVYFSLDTWPYWAHIIRISFQSNAAGFWAYWTCVFLVLLALLVLPVSLMGATVPIAFHEIKRDLASVGRHSGLLFSWNTIGNLVGSLAGGVVLFTVMNIPGIFSLAVFFAALSACLAAWKLSLKHLAAAGTLAAASLVMIFLTPSYEIKNFALGTFRIREPLPYSFGGPRDFFARFNADWKLIYYKDGPMTSAGVIESLAAGPPFPFKPRSIIVNGKSDSSTAKDLYTTKLSAHIPALMAERRKNVLVIGMGTGVTAGELTLYPDVEKIDIAEIAPTVVRALPYFSKDTHGVQNDPRVQIHLGDAFRILGRSDKKWDIIISEPSNPWVTGVDSLYTTEFYRLARQHMTKTGLLVQWTHTYDSSPEMMGMIVKTLVREFGQTHVFLGNSGDVLMLASSRRFSASDIERAEAAFGQLDKVRQSLKILKVETLESILVRELWTPSYLSYFFADFGLQTMDNPRLHYMAGKRFFLGTGLPDDFLFGPDGAPYVDEYLMVMKHGDWRDFSFSPAETKALQSSFDRELRGGFQPIVSALKLKAFLEDPAASPLTEKEKKTFRPELVRLITGKSGSEEDWSAAGLKGASFRERAQALLGHVAKTRSWIVPYPLEGLKSLLEKGMAQEREDHEKNWCALQLALLATYGDKSAKSARKILGSAVRGKGGKILLKKEDEALLKSLQIRLSKLSSTSIKE
jgi:spermidine synthase